MPLLRVYSDISLPSNLHMSHCWAQVSHDERAWTTVLTRETSHTSLNCFAGFLSPKSSIQKFNFAHNFRKTGCESRLEPTTLCSRGGEPNRYITTTFFDNSTMVLWQSVHRNWWSQKVSFYILIFYTVASDICIIILITDVCHLKLSVKFQSINANLH